MKYDHILIRYGELSLKGKNTKHFLNKLQRNIEHKLVDYPKIHIKRTQGRMIMLLNGQDPEPIIEKCKDIFGIHSFSLAIRVESELELIKEAALYALENGEDVKTFKVVVKRAAKSFPIGSQEMNQVIGEHLLTHTDQFTVDVHNPDIEVKVDIRNNGTYITSSIISGLSGFPVGTSGKSLLLLSGGIDSPVAGYLAMRRGVQIEAIHFHSPPFTSERAKQKVLDLAQSLTKYGEKIKIHLVPFTKLQQEIFNKMPDRYSMTIMRRIMIRVSEQICIEDNILSMTTGESLGQVASQTMESMNAINEVTNYPILRPLVMMDKQDIIKIARDINTYDISIRPYEDCCTVFVPKEPKTNPRRNKVNYFESQIDFTDLIAEAVANTEIATVSDVKQLEPAFEELL